jgi:hypothetical protein
MDDEVTDKANTATILSDKLLGEVDQGTVSRLQMHEARRLSRLQITALTAFRASRSEAAYTAYLSAADAFISYVEPLVKQQPE